MDDDSDIKPSFSTRRRWSQRLKLILDLFCVVALIAMANYFGARHYSRGHLTADTRHELSSQTRLILQALTNDVRITVFFDRNQALYHDVTELVSEFGESSLDNLVENWFSDETQAALNALVARLAAR